MKPTLSTYLTQNYKVTRAVQVAQTQGVASKLFASRKDWMPVHAGMSSARHYTASPEYRLHCQRSQSNLSVPVDRVDAV